MTVMDETGQVYDKGLAATPEIRGLDGYLTVFGNELVRKVTEIHAPLHVPGVDPIPSFEYVPDDRYPFEAQAHVVSALTKMLQEQSSGFCVGEMGCIAGESMIYDPIARVHRRVDQITEPFHVVSERDGKAVIGHAHVPFIKGTKELYRVTMSNRRSFLATDDHRVLTRHGYLTVATVADYLRRSEPCPLPSIGDTYPLVSPQDVRHSSRRPSGSPDDYPHDCHSRDEQPLLASDTDRASFPSRDDALERTHRDPREGGQADRQECTHPCLSSDRPSTWGCSNPADPVALVGASSRRAFSALCEPDASLGPDDLQSGRESRHSRTTGSSPQQASQSCCASPSSSLGEFGNEVHVTSVVYVRTDVYYDFTVEDYRNYVMEGVVHHNTGKTELAVLAMHELFSKSFRQGGRNGRYRIMVLCPDHLIDKWCREVREVLPEAHTHQFDHWTELFGVARALRESGETTPHGTPAHWSVPGGPEWYVFGRNQIKWEPVKMAVGERQRPGYGGKITKAPTVVVSYGKDYVLDENGRPKRDADGHYIYEWKRGRHYICPRCGATVKSRKGVALSAGDLKGYPICTAKWLVEIPELSKKTADQHGRDLMELPDRYKDSVTGREVKYGGRTWRVTECNEPLWQWAVGRTGRRWSMANIIQSRLRRFFHGLVVDEVHEQKEDTSARSQAMGKVLGGIPTMLALTGTLIGGKADHLFPLLMRMAPRDMIDRGFEWGKRMPFAEMYGRIDTVTTTTAPYDVTFHKTGVGSKRRVKTGDEKVYRKVAPGVMPTLFSQLLIDKSVFITLEEVADELPPYVETLIGVDMPPVILEEYSRIEKIMYAVVRQMLVKGGRKFLGKMLHTLMQYPDHPYGWLPPFPDQLAVGFWEISKLYTPENYRGVVSPINFDLDAENIILPKEQKLIEICKATADRGDQAWVYCMYTGKMDVRPRLRRLLMQAGLTVGILEARDVDTREREAWIAAHGPLYNVMLSHPEPVSTGLDLFAKDGKHNFSTLVFYQTGYRLDVLRQAARRSWRIGQLKPCEVYFLFTTGTMQHRAMELMGRKLSAAEQLEGEFSVDGLAAMSNDSSLQMALIKSIAEKIDDTLIHRNWSKVQSKEGTHHKSVDLPFDPLEGDVDLEFVAKLSSQEPGKLDLPHYQAIYRMAREIGAATAYDWRTKPDILDCLVELGLAAQIQGMWHFPANQATAEKVIDWIKENWPHAARTRDEIPTLWSEAEGFMEADMHAGMGDADFPFPMPEPPEEDVWDWDSVEYEQEEEAVAPPAEAAAPAPEPPKPVVVPKPAVVPTPPKPIQPVQPVQPVVQLHREPEGEDEDAFPETDDPTLKALQSGDLDFDDWVAQEIEKESQKAEPLKVYSPEEEKALAEMARKKEEEELARQYDLLMGTSDDDRAVKPDEWDW